MNTNVSEIEQITQKYKIDLNNLNYKDSIYVNILKDISNKFTATFVIIKVEAMKKKSISQNSNNKGKEEAINKLYEDILELGRKAFNERMYNFLLLHNLEVTYCHNKKDKNVEKAFQSTSINIINKFINNTIYFEKNLIYLSDKLKSS